MVATSRLKEPSGKEETCCPKCGGWPLDPEKAVDDSPIIWCDCPTPIPGEYENPLGGNRDKDKD